MREPVKGADGGCACDLSVQAGHAWLAQHYKWALDRAFIERQHSHVIIVEDDMLFSPDFLRYFEAMAVLLELDSSLFCISAYNDYGLQGEFRSEQHRMFRTSYFPGLVRSTPRSYTHGCLVHQCLQGLGCVDIPHFMYRDG